MRRIFNIFIIFIALTISLLLEPNSFQNQSIDSLSYIQNIREETVTLVSDNILNGEISSIQEENNQNYSTSSPSLLTIQSNKYSLGKYLYQ